MRCALRLGAWRQSTRHCVSKCELSSASGTVPRPRGQDCQQLWVLPLMETSQSRSFSAIAATSHWTCTTGGDVPSRCYAKGRDKKGKKDKGGHKTVALSDEELMSVIDVPEMKHKMEMTLAHMKKEYVDQLSLRTSIGSLDNLIVKTPDGDYPLIQLAQIVQKSPQLIVVDMSALPQYTGQVKDAIANSGMNLNPQQDGSSLFVPVPKVTKEFREGLAKNAKVICDKTKEKFRHIQNNYIRDLQKAKKEGSASENLVHNLDDHVHGATKDFIAQAETMMKLKQKELLDSK